MRLLPLILLAACTTGGDKTCATGGLGTLDLALTFPTDAMASPGRVVVYDDTGAQVAAADTATTLTDLPSGLYTLAFVRAESAAAGVDASGGAWGLLTQTVQEVCVPADDTVTVTADYVAQPSGGHLWVSSGERLAGYTNAALSTSGDAAADLTLDITPTNDLRGFAFDPMGNLWVATSPTYDTRLLVFEPGTVDASGTTEPDFTLASPVFSDLTQVAELAFDGDGNLWVLARGSNSSFVGLYVYTPAQQRTLLLGGDAGDPAYTRTVPGLVTPMDMVFGPGGDLWIADFDGNAVLRIPAADLTPSALDSDTTLTPAASIVGHYDNGVVSGDYEGPNDLTLTSDGMLWVTYWTSATLAGFANANDLDGTLLPDVTAATGTMSLPAGLATDATDGVWYGNEPQTGTGELVRVDATGSAPVTVRTTDAPTPIDLAFDPVP